MRVIVDLIFLSGVLLIVGCAFYESVQPCRQPVMSPPCVDMSGASMMWQSTTEPVRLPPVQQQPVYRLPPTL
jgi:hypothetical protein